VLPPRPPYIIPLPDGDELHLGGRCLVMGVLNVTPDSFGDAAPCMDAAAACERALAMEAAGADLIDIGGESTRPGARPVDAVEEAARVLPVIRSLRGRLRVPMSIDTTKAEVARAAVAEGAALVNDISGLAYDPGMGAAIAGTGAAAILMHMRGRPDNMYAHARYADLRRELAAELRESVQRAEAAGISRSRIIVDPGIGFAKRPPDSYGVFAHIHHLGAELQRPVLVGPSRKSFMAEALGGRPAASRDWGTAAAVTAAVLAGAHIVRVHAVGEMAQVVRVAERIRGEWTD
jgi:dihydropteroate synthase